MNELQPVIDGITVTEFRDTDGTGDWPVIADGATAFFPTASFADSARFVAAIAAIEGIDAHQPDLDVRWDGVTVRIVSKGPNWYGMSRRDVDLARQVSEVAGELGLRADPSLVQVVAPIVIGVNDTALVRPFWAALFAYVPRPDSPEDDLVDPHDRGPGIWFEPVEGPRLDRNRMHVAVWVPYAQAEARVAAAVAAGGSVIYDAQAPAWWTLADPEGNEADVSTTMTRD